VLAPAPVDRLDLICERRTKDESVPPKVRELIANLDRAGFVNRGGKGSHRNFVHPNVAKLVPYPATRAMMQSITRSGWYSSPSRCRRAA
jgi:predicted RNA binding protein YcfA (HicA-like mRNA interferase family)